MARIRFAARSDQGKVRTSNEDSVGLFPDINLFLVADGMGGHAGGEVASQMAVDLVRDYFQKDLADGNTSPIPERLQKAIKLANLKIYETGRQTPSLSGMGTTIVCAVVEEKKAHIAYVGDSRAYLAKTEVIEQITYDHSLVYEYLKLGMMRPEEAEHHPLKHVLSRALGTSSNVEVDTLSLELNPGETLLLCSDGLSNTVSDQDMLQNLKSKGQDIEGACQALIEAANNNGGIDNITVALLQCAEEPAL